ncbi:MAG: hypothetical protein L0Z50_20515 [Verrucomicrobiales bacterium]|nr:hypothetical protein [Verrucomicrobiales bacterium]
MLVSLFAQADELLTKRLDGLAVQFKDAQPDFYNTYRIARRIVSNPAGRASEPATNVVVAPNAASGGPLVIAKAA